MAIKSHTKEQIMAMRTKPEVRWHADSDGNVYDADFKYDAMLRIDGDFGSNIRKQQYAQAVADALNAYWPDSDAGPMKPIPPCHDGFTHLWLSSTGIGKTETRCTRCGIPYPQSSQDPLFKEEKA